MRIPQPVLSTGPAVIPSEYLNNPNQFSVANIPTNYEQQQQSHLVNGHRDNVNNYVNPVFALYE